MRPLVRSEARDAALVAMLPHVPYEGWTFRALRTALAGSGEDPGEARLLFPDGPAEMVEAWCDLADRRMAREAAGLDLPAMRVPARVRALVALRLEQARPDRDAVRRALALLALPPHAPAAARSLARTADAIWNAAGDTATGFARHSKRATLGAVYAATLLAWLRDDTGDDAATLAFLDRRLADIAGFGRARQRLRDLACRLPAARGT